jgi:hypothetical protein
MPSLGILVIVASLLGARHSGGASSSLFAHDASLE